MHSKSSICALACGLFFAASQASAVTITFDELTSGVTLANQYAGLGAIFSPNAFSGTNPRTGAPWATNTDMTVVDSNNNGQATYGTPLLVSGNVLHSYNGWLNEATSSGVPTDPSIKVSFSTPVKTFSADFAGVAGFVGTGNDVAIYAYNGASLLGRVTGQEGVAGQFTLSFSAPSITSVVMTPGSGSDYVAIDNVTFTLATPVPEASTYGMMALGMGLLALRRRRT
jgi:PEP-CTERM motif